MTSLQGEPLSSPENATTSNHHSTTPCIHQQPPYCRFGSLCRSAMCQLHDPDNSGATLERKKAKARPAQRPHQRRRAHRLRRMYRRAGEHSRSPPDWNWGTPRSGKRVHHNRQWDTQRKRCRKHQAPNTPSADQASPPGGIPGGGGGGGPGGIPRGGTRGHSRGGGGAGGHSQGGGGPGGHSGGGGAGPGGIPGGGGGDGWVLRPTRSGPIRPNRFCRAKIVLPSPVPFRRRGGVRGRGGGGGQGSF